MGGFAVHFKLRTSSRPSQIHFIRHHKELALFLEMKKKASSRKASYRGEIGSRLGKSGSAVILLLLARWETVAASVPYVSAHLALRRHRLDHRRPNKRLASNFNQVMEAKKEAPLRLSAAKKKRKSYYHT